MKIAPSRLDSFLRRPDPKVRAILVYGPDQGLIRERLGILAHGVVEDLKDAFRVADLTAEQIVRDPARLADEMAAISMIGGRRLVRLRGGDEPLTPTFAALFGAPPPGDTMVLVEAGDLGKSSKLRALFEAADIAAAIPCYVEGESELGSVIGDMVRRHGFAIGPEARDLLAAHLVGDRMVARNEIDKLLTYMGTPAPGQSPQIEIADVEACIGDSSQLALDDAAWAAADGDYKSVDRALGRLFAQGESPVAILRLAQRHFQRLHLVVGRAARGEGIDRAIESLKPPVFYKQKSRFQTQARRWTPTTLRLALDRLTEAETECKRTHMPDKTLCARTFFQLAAWSRVGQNR